MRRPFHLLALVLASVLASVTLTATLGAQPIPPGARDAGPAPLTAQDRARRAKAVARIGSVQITVGDVEDAINSQSPFLRARYRDPEKLREFVQNMIRFELLARAASKRGYGRDQDVERTVSQNAVQQLIRRDFDERITVDSVPEADVRTYYDAHPEEFHRPEMVRASHVLLADRAEAQRLIAQARQLDARGFRDLARERSIDTETKLRGGDLRYFTRDARPGAGADVQPGPDAHVDPAIVTAAFRLREVGDVTAEPVHVGNAWSVIKLTGRRPAEHRTIEEAGPTIRMRLWRERRQRAIEEFVASLRRRYSPQVFPDRMQPIRLDPAPEGGGLPGFPGGGHGHESEGEGEPAPRRPR